MNYASNLSPFPCFQANSTSLASKYLTREIYDRLIHIRTRHGFTLNHALRSGIDNPDSSIGIYAGDEESYDVFSDIFIPVIKQYHDIDEILKYPAKSDLTAINFPDPDPEHKYIISTRIRVARNLADFPFTPVISSIERKKVEKIILESLEDIKYSSTSLSFMTHSLTGHYIPIKESVLYTNQMKPDVSIPSQSACIPSKDVHVPSKDVHIPSKDVCIPSKKVCIQSKSAFKKGDRFQESAGINRDWPESRGVFESNDQKFLVWINEEDHLRIISIDQGGNIS
ncbi:MAG: hypothetical protein HQK67_10235, partial [Desulfamplus sp.]|nr:hypothetical protein [Desulfamplus sp.]